MQEVSVKLIEQAIYSMCYEANIFLPQLVFDKIESASQFDEQSKYILKNAQIAAEMKRPLCQDTGQVIVFCKIGQDVHFKDGNLSKAINSAVKRCYKDNSFRLSVVQDALFNRTNTSSNTPCVIHTEIVDGDEIELSIMIKGGGSENVTGSILLNPTITKEEFNNEVLKIIQNAQKNACPPMFVGLGVGQTLETAILLSKKAILFGNSDNNLCDLLNQNIKIGLNTPVLDVKILTSASHIACLPLGVTILCHSNRFHSCKITDNNIIYTTLMHKECFNNIDISKTPVCDVDINTLKNVCSGQKVFYTGKIYTARDMAHKKFVNMIENKEKLPIELNNAIIFYAGPCPQKQNEISGPIGPTTAKRMDNFAIPLYENGVIATFAKGNRNKKILDYLCQTGKKYFEVQGGIASYLAQCVKSSKIVAFEELGTEAIYELEVEKFPITCVV